MENLVEHKEPVNVLFTGYAPVHFVCFRPLYQRLAASPDFNVFVSGGLRSKAETGYHYDGPGLFDPFNVPKESVLTIDEIAHRDFDILFAANTKLIKPRNVETCIQIFHGISFRNRAIRLENMTCDYYFLVGPYMHRKFKEMDLLSENDPRALDIGFLKTDPLVNGQLNRNDLLNQYGFDGSRPVILYAPTGEKHNSLETMGEDVIRRLSESNQFDLLIKLHDHPKNKTIDWFAQLAPLENQHTKVIRDFDVIPPLYLADLLITDASSVSSEYALVDRPMVFLHVPKLIARMMERKASMLDMDTWGRQSGTVVKLPDNIVDLVNHSLANPKQQADVRQEMAKDLFYNPGAATDTAMAWLTDRFSHHGDQPISSSKASSAQ